MQTRIDKMLMHLASYCHEPCYRTLLHQAHALLLHGEPLSRVNWRTRFGGPYEHCLCRTIFRVISLAHSRSPIHYQM